jgi:gluconokinase
LNDAMSAYAGQVVVMGVAGCGKSTVGQMLAARLDAEFLEGDELHPPRNVQRMAAGVPLTDEDRHEWLQALAQRIAEAQAASQGLVVSCSALKRAYRDVLRGASPELAFIYLHGQPALLMRRLEQRVGHYMPASLLASQFEILQPPGDDEHALALDAHLPAERLAADAAAWVATTDNNHDRRADLPA